MRKPILLFIMFALLLACAAWPGSRAQSGKPSQALREVTEHRMNLAAAPYNNAQRPSAPSSGASSRSGPAPAVAPDEEEVNEAIIKFASERAAAFKVKDWKGEELVKLGELYQAAEQFAPAVEAFRAFLKSYSKSDMYLLMRPWTISNARSNLILSLIEAEQLDEAETWMEGMEWIVGENPHTLAVRPGLYIKLAVAFRDRGKYDKVATLSDKGYKLASSLVLSGNLLPQMLEMTERNLVVLAAMSVAAYERGGRKREAEDLNELALDFDFDRLPELRSAYESELTTARLIGAPAPELEVSRWIEGKERTPKDLNELRGNVVLLYFWAMGSDPFVDAFPRLRRFQSNYGGKGFEIIGVTKFYGRSDTEVFPSREQEIKGLQNYKSRHQLTYPFAVGKMDDVTNEERYGGAGVPTMILIDRQGLVRHVNRGAGDYRKLEKQIEKLLGEK
ncbi:MAG TPA: TlpA disulfide reductase family protein [Blastocatellia bacterium]|nr:TlpA disulfide reductase family protein [Blastocatellia bacterium]